MIRAVPNIGGDSSGTVWAVVGEYRGMWCVHQQAARVSSSVVSQGTAQLPHCRRSTWSG